MNRKTPVILTQAKPDGYEVHTVGGFRNIQYKLATWAEAVAFRLGLSLGFYVASGRKMKDATDEKTKYEHL